MPRNDTHHAALERLLGTAGTSLMEGATIVAWQPDLNYEPLGYYAKRVIDEPGFRRLADDVGFAVAVSPRVVEGIWQLPPGASFAEWTADRVPLGSGLQASGSLGNAAVWMRWYRGEAFIVVQSSS